MATIRGWDIVCRIVDNFGDIGICWRLARQIACERRELVRLWVDDMATAARLLPAIDSNATSQSLDGVEILPLNELASPPFYAIIIEAFACGLPPAWLEQMAAMPAPPLWINLEYLSAESWVEGCHRLSSRQPRLPLTQHYFFPGFTPATGGLLRESGLLQRHAVSQVDALPVAGWRPVMGTTVSIFCYGNPALPALLQHWAEGSAPYCLLVAPGLPRLQVEAWLGQVLDDNAPRKRGQLHLIALPWLNQAEYDRLLRGCDINLVRGEDSIVRAMWAACPWLWHIYPTPDNAHHTKLDALLQRLEFVCPAGEVASMRQLSEAWNQPAPERITQCWDAYVASLPQQGKIARDWQQYLAAQDDLLAQLASFALSKL